MPHSDDGLELLNVPSVNAIGVVLHIMRSKEYSFFMNMIKDL